MNKIAYITRSFKQSCYSNLILLQSKINTSHDRKNNFALLKSPLRFNCRLLLTWIADASKWLSSTRIKRLSISRDLYPRLWQMQTVKQMGGWNFFDIPFPRQQDGQRETNCLTNNRKNTMNVLHRAVFTILYLYSLKHAYLKIYRYMS